MRGVNKVILMGNLGVDPTVRYGDTGNAVTSFSMATNEVWRNKEGEVQERTEWHRIVLFGRLAEVAGEHLKSGSQVYIEGKKKTRSWDKDGETQYTVEIVADEMIMMGGSND